MQTEVKAKLMARFGLSDIQTTAILDMQLRKLAALERQKSKMNLYDTGNHRIPRRPPGSPEKYSRVVKTNSKNSKKIRRRAKNQSHKKQNRWIADEQLIPIEDVIITMGVRQGNKTTSEIDV